MNTLKWTCDRDGNWRQVPVKLTRSGTGYLETRVQTDVISPTLPADDPEIDRLLTAKGY